MKKLDFQTNYFWENKLGNISMATRLKYQEIIKTILQEAANFRNNIPDGYHSQLLFDECRG
jgi:hypothetical protein